ncbi:MAG: YraN family protein [Prevotella sp.]|nr:YraN family protein [Prevotella sp.]
MAQHNELGAWGEALAAEYLQRKGYDIVARNHRYGHIDLDIIALCEDTIIFIEVKTRRSRIFGDPAEAVNPRKLQNLRQAISHYLKQHRINQDIRFDIVTVVGIPNDDAEPEISHIQDVPLL